MMIMNDDGDKAFCDNIDRRNSIGCKSVSEIFQCQTLSVGD